MRKLDASFYAREDVVTIARELLGKILVTNWKNQETAGRIVETEAYAGESDRASHASKGRTRRTEVMFGDPGRAYIYLCYGLHQMFNIVTAPGGIPHAVLIRGVEPVSGQDHMMKRFGSDCWRNSFTIGPGNVGRAFGFHTSQCGVDLTSNDVFVADDGWVLSPDTIKSSPRIGVHYAGEHANWPYRFYVQNSSFVSGKKSSEPGG